jgi:hypothetical protein
MYQKDYILRMIEQLSVVLARILFNKELKNYDQAQLELDNAFKGLLKFDPDVIISLSEKELMELVRSTEGVPAEKYIVMAELIRENAELLELRRTFEFTVTDLYMKSFSFYMEFIDAAGEIDTSQYIQTLLKIEKKLTQFEWPDWFKLRLFRYYEMIGIYAKAEDMLFDILKTNPGEAEQLGRDFYDRLLRKSIQELEAGNLPYDEVLEGKKSFEIKLGEKD